MRNSKTVPFGWGLAEPTLAVTPTVSPIAIGRCAVIEFSMCTVPIAGAGNAGSLMIPICSSKASRCG